MKNTYVKPEMQVEEFLANQYVAKCVDGTYYTFKCDISGDVYWDKNQDGIRDSNSRIYNNSACGHLWYADGSTIDGSEVGKSVWATAQEAAAWIAENQNVVVKQTDRRGNTTYTKAFYFEKAYHTSIGTLDRATPITVHVTNS